MRTGSSSRITWIGFIEALLYISAFILGVGGLALGGWYVWLNPTATRVTIQTAPTALPKLRAVATPATGLAAPVPATAVVEPITQTSGTTPITIADDANARDATLSMSDGSAPLANAVVRCQTPTVWGLPVADARTRLSATFGLQDTDSVYFQRLMTMDILPSGTITVFHPGIDFAVDVGTPVFAVAQGTVTTVVDDDVLYGKHLILKMDGYDVLFAHLSQTLVDVGQTVQCGQKIALSGATGKAITGAHLHLEMRRRNKPIDPLPFIRKALAADAE